MDRYLKLNKNYHIFWSWINSMDAH